MRVAVPLSAQPSAKPHAPKLPHEPMPQLVPSVEREQASISVASLGTHAPAVQA